MKLLFYIVITLFQAHHFNAMETNSQPPTTITDSTSTTVIPNTPQSNIPPIKLSEHLKKYNLNPENIPNWEPGKIALFDTIKKSNLGSFKNSFNNLPWALRTQAVIPGCLHTCYTTAVNLENEIEALDTKISNDPQHDYLTIGKYSIIEANYIGACTFLALITKMIVNSIDKFRPYTSLTGATDTKFVTKSSVILLASSIGICLSALGLDAAKNIYKAWNHKDTLQQQKVAVTKSLDEIPQIVGFMEATKKVWVDGYCIAPKSSQDKEENKK